MIFPCPTATPPCDGSENPLTNFSSESADPPIRIGYSTGTAPTPSLRHFGGAGPVPGLPSGPGPADPPGPLVDIDTAGTGTGGDPPPLDSIWDNSVVTTFVEVTDPTVNPADEAGNNNIDQLNGSGGVDSGGRRQPSGAPYIVFVNHPQTCTIMCSDGNPFSFTVPVGKFRATNQASADSAAYSYACKQAYLNRVCLSNINGSACVGESFNQTVNADAANIPINFSVISGSFPSWLTAVASPTAFNLSGTPASGDIGSSTFTVQATDSLGFTMTKAYTIVVIGISGGTELPAFSKNSPYSQQITAIGGTGPYTFSTVSGDFPPGLTMSTSGLVSGAPTVDPGLYPVLISITDADGHSCNETISFSTACVPAIAPALDTGYVIATGKAVFVNKTGTIFAVNGSDGKTLLEVSSSGTILNSWSIGADAISMIFYENTHQMVYVGYRVGVAQNFGSINPSTRSLVNTTAITGIPGLFSATYDPNLDNIWASNGNDTLFVINATSFAYTALVGAVNFVVGPDHFDPNGEPVYCDGLGVVFVPGTYFSPGTTAGCAVINAATLSPSITNFTTSDLTYACAFCPSNNRVYLVENPVATVVYVINPSSPNLGTSVALTGGNGYGVAWNPCTSRIEVVVLNGANLITMNYINPTTNLVTGTVLTGFVEHQFNPSLAWYDSNNARVWVGTKTALLKFT